MSHNRQKDKEHAAVVAKAKARNQEAMPPPAIPPHVPPSEKTLTTMMPQSTPSVPVSIHHPEATPLRALMSSEGPRPLGTSSSSPSFTKAVDFLDSTNVIDLLAEYWQHYLPDETLDEIDMEEPDDDSRAITEMELDYQGVVSTREDLHRGEYGDLPTYHAIPRGLT